jgi:succinate dehydrogenase/fumarate reductase cytochrome b subunit
MHTYRIRRPTAHWQLLGREYYQTTFGERYLLFGPLFIHSSSAIIKRIFCPRISRPLTSAISVTGYTIAFCILPVHILTHRLAPADPAPPISSLSPSELDYEYVKAALSVWPRRSIVLYSALVLGVALHAADGIGIIWSTWSALGLRPPPGRRTRFALAGTAVAPVLMGLVVLAREPLYAFVSMAARYRAALIQCIVYRL